MKPFFLLLGIALCLAACNPSQTPAVVTVPHTDTLIKKIVVFFTDNTYSYLDSSEFAYDSRGRIIKERYDGTSNGTNITETAVTRDANGVITAVDYSFYIANNLRGTGHYLVRYDNATQRYLNKIVKDSNGIVIDSTVYSYTEQNLTRAVQWQRSRPYQNAPTYTPLYAVNRQTYTYDSADRAKLVVRETQAPASGFWAWEGINTNFYSYLKNPLYTKDFYAFIAGFSIRQVPSSNFMSWELESTSPSMPDSMRKESSYSFGIKWQYTLGGNDRPVMRKGTVNGITTIIYYKY